MPAVYDSALAWARDSYDRLEGRPHTGDALVAECRRSLPEFPGLDRKKWLFVYSPAASEPLFEVGFGFARLLTACARLHAVAADGGMLFGADCSLHWATPRCVPKYVPLAVCKPQATAPAAGRPRVPPRPVAVEELAARLKRRLRRMGLATKKQLALMNGEDMFWSYLQCVECGERFAPDLPPVLAAASSEEEFVALSQWLRALHEAGRHGSTVDLPTLLDEPLTPADLRAAIRDGWGIDV